MLVREIMTAPAVSIHVDAALDDAIDLLAGKRITLLPVVDDDEHLVGVLSEIDVLRRAVEPDARGQITPLPDSTPLPEHIAEIMTRTPKTTTEGADVADLVDVFVSTSIKSLPVIRGQRLIGVVSRSDIIRALWRRDEDLLDDLHAAFADYGQEGWSIAVERGVVTVSGTGSAQERDIAMAIARSVLGVRRVRVEGADGA
ncbi:MAG: CBS domain-containing protein [Mobilicoccus sp.]|nr:CBS domain-containing protein [Mobilicoccus sp.]